MEDVVLHVGELDQESFLKFSSSSSRAKYLLFPRKVSEAGADILADQILASLVLALYEDLALELVGAEADVHGGIATLWLNLLAVLVAKLAALATAAGSGADAGILPVNLVVVSDTEVETFGVSFLGVLESVSVRKHLERTAVFRYR